MKKYLFAVVAAALAGLAPGAWATEWNVDPATSKLGWQARFNGQGVEGTFKSWTAKISFDPNNLDASSITIQVNVASVESGDGARDETLRGADWFNAGQFAAATFTSQKIKTMGAVGENKYVAAGTLTINGVTKPLALPFTLAINGEKASAQGEITLSRGAFGVGKGQWKDNAEVQDLVKVTYTVNATAAAAKP